VNARERDTSAGPGDASEAPLEERTGTTDADVPIRQPGVGTDQHAAVRRPDAPTSETGGPEGPEPTRYGDWERNGRCSDF